MRIGTVAGRDEAPALGGEIIVTVRCDSDLLRGSPPGCQVLLEQ